MTAALAIASAPDRRSTRGCAAGGAAGVGGGTAGVFTVSTRASVSPRTWALVKAT